MQLDLMLCDHAQVAGGKLFVSGAGIDRMMVPARSTAPYVVSFAIAGVVILSPEDAARNHNITFQVLTAQGRIPTLADADRQARPVNGELGIIAGELTAQEDQVVSVAFSFQGVPLFGLGEHVVVVAIDGNEARRISFVVEAAS